MMLANQAVVHGVVNQSARIDGDGDSVQGMQF